MNLIPPQVIRNQVLALRQGATLVVRGVLGRDELLDVALGQALAIVRKTRPDWSEIGLRTQLAWILQDAIIVHERACARTDNEIRWALRAMIRGPQAPTEADPEGKRRPAFDDLVAEALAINNRNGAPLWSDPERFTSNEVLAIVEEETLHALRRMTKRRAA